MSNDTWRGVPSYVRAYINSENDKDRARALELCQQYGLDYGQMRLVVLAEIIAESEALGKGVPRREG